MKFHNTLLQCLAAFLFFICSGTKAQAVTISSQGEANLRAQSLIAANNTTDSIRILLDVYNLSDRPNRDKVRQQLLNLATKSNNEEVIGDVIKELSTSTDDTRDLKRLIELSENLPQGNQSESYMTVLQMEHANSEASSVLDSQLKNQLEDYSRQAASFTGNPYKEIQNIYRTMVYLGSSSQGAMYYEYIKRLEELVEDLPKEDYAIKNVFYTNAAIFYTRKRDWAKAIEFDRKLIKQLDSMKAAYEKEGKDIKDLDYFYYVSNRRMLRNFRGLSQPEIEEAYAVCVELAEKNDRVKEEFDSGGLANSYYFIATGQYAKAIPELKKALQHPDISSFRRQELLGLLAQAQRSTGDKNGELESLRDYTRMIEDEREERRESMYREIELRSSVDRVMSDEIREQEQQRQENRVMRKTALTLVYVLAVVLIFLCQAYFRLRQKVKTLEFKNNSLRKNIEYIFDDGVPKGSKDLRNKRNRLKG